MLSNADSQHLRTPVATLSASVDAGDKAEKKAFAKQKIWLPRLLYVALPWFYLLAGTGAFLATLYINAWFWILPHYVLFSIGCIHLGLLILRRRRAYRRDIQNVDADA